MKVFDLNGKWELARYECADTAPEYIADFGDSSLKIDASVPGDVHIDLQRAGLLPDLMYSDNYLQADWVQNHDWCYTRTFTVDSLENHTELVFEGLGLYATVFLNGQKIGATENAFVAHRFWVDDVIKLGENTISVYFSSVNKKTESFCCDGLNAAFHIPRLFMRKPQCQFSWDWAPSLAQLGIWQDVKLVSHHGHRIKHIRIDTLLDSRATAFFEIDGEDAKWYGDKRNFVVKLASVEGPESDRSYKVRLIVSDGEKQHTFEETFQDYREFFTFKIEDPKLWWPHDMGDQPLYDYTFEYFEDGVLSDSVSGRFAFRTVRVNQEPRDNERGLKFELLVNEVPVFLKGGNWVPIDCFPAVVGEDRYRDLLTLAKHGNINALRVWGAVFMKKTVSMTSAMNLELLYGRMYISPVFSQNLIGPSPI